MLFWGIPVIISEFMDNTDIDKTIGALVYVPVSLLGVMIMFGFNKKIEGGCPR